MANLDLTPSRHNSITLRSILIGLFWAILLVSIVPYNDFYLGGTFLAGNHFPIGPVFILLILVLFVNAVLLKIKPIWALSDAEITTVWCMMLGASGLSSTGVMRYLTPKLIIPYYFATPENAWADLFYQHIPDWLVVKDKSAITHFYEGLPSGETVPWRLWLTPLFSWISIFFLLYVMMACISNVLRKQWVEKERYVFPLVQLPVDMVRSPETGRLWNTFMRNRKMWIGFSIVVFIHGLNGLHSFFPALLRVPLHFSMRSVFAEKPWDAMNPFSMNIYLSVIGFSYLLTLEVLLSIWFFFLLYKVQSVLLSAFGMSLSASAGFGFAKEFSASQEMGASFIFVGFLLWNARSYLRNIFVSAVLKRSRDPFRPKQNTTAEESLSYELSILGWVASIIILCLILNLAGMSFFIALAIILLYVMVCIILTWQVSNAGMLLVNPSFAPDNLMEGVLGSSRMGIANLTVLALMPRSLMRDQREFMMPNIMHTLRISDSANLRRRSLLFVMFLAIIVAFPFAAYFSVRLNYFHPGVKGYAFSEQSNPFHRLASLIESPTDTNLGQLTFIGIGAGFMVFLVLMRAKFLWWSLHPIGYTMFSSWAVLVLWFSFFLGWLMKTVIVRYGGSKAYRTARPLFLGLVLGESFMCIFWNLVGFVTGHAYRIMPG